ncbi:uncharacterized protein LOC113172873 [Anabas testudineus]|uniref:uncharacterized protein LOC113172873 n=1 Tax=Anabas testudineus TaxID=64144 RepID=UPI000E465650|nr:uncharacterized protein LOC113172873 [Anabas testudineus]
MVKMKSITSVSVTFTEGKTITEVVGSTVMLPCNQSVNKINQLTWTMNSKTLLSYRPGGLLYTHPEAERLNITMSLSESERYTLIIKRAEKNHTGNYTCEATIAEKGILEQTWELIITDHEQTGNWIIPLIPVAVIVPCVCCLIFIFAMIILRRSCKCRAKSRHPTAEMRKQPEDIYENCLEIDVRQRSSHPQPHHCNHRAQ